MKKAQHTCMHQIHFNVLKFHSTIKHFSSLSLLTIVYTTPLSSIHFHPSPSPLTFDPLSPSISVSVLPPLSLFVNFCLHPHYLCPCAHWNLHSAGFIGLWWLSWFNKIWSYRFYRVYQCTHPNNPMSSKSTLSHINVTDRISKFSIPDEYMSWSVQLLSFVER